MKRLLSSAIIVLTGLGLQAGIMPEVMLDVNGVKHGLIPLNKPEGKNLKVYHPGWQKGDKRACYLSVKSKALPLDKWTEFSLSFVPGKSGKVDITLMGKIHRVAGKSAPIYTLYDDFNAAGIKLINSDFEELDDHGNFEGWGTRWGIQPYKTDLGQSAKVRYGNALTQTVQVIAGQKVTLGFKARGFAAFEGKMPEVASKGKKGGKQDIGKKTVNGKVFSGKEGMWPALWCPSFKKIDVTKIKVSPCAFKDISLELQSRLDKGEKNITLPDGTFKISALTIPADVTLKGGTNTTLVLDSNLPAPVITLKGDNITLDSLSFKLHNSVLIQALTGKRMSMIKGEKINNIVMNKIKYVNSAEQYNLIRGAVQAAKPGNKRMRVKLWRWDLVELADCKGIEVMNCMFKNFCSGIKTTQCTRVSFHNNIGVNGLHNMMRFYNGSEYFKFYNNWFSHVKHPMVWDGGDCSPHNKNLKPGGPEAARKVYRNMKLGDKDYAQHMTGTYEVLCYGNYGEYGKTLAWGRKGRRVIVSGNSARYMYDMAFDAEGCEEVIFANNIAVNCKAAGIGAFYYNDSTSITGNVIVIEDIGHEIYKGQFVRMHSAHGVSSGKTIISGNLFVNHLKEPRYVKLDYCKDVLIADNKFVNGGILTNRYGGGNATVTGNTFISLLPKQETLISVAKILKEFTFRNNTMINRNPKATPGEPAIKFDFTVTPKLEKERPGVDAAAAFRQVDGNSIRGWDVPVEFSSRPGKQNTRVIFCNNLYEGKPAVSVTGSGVINKNNTSLK